MVSIDPAVLDQAVKRLDMPLPRRILAHLGASAEKARETQFSDITRRVATEREPA